MIYIPVSVSRNGKETGDGDDVVKLITANFKNVFILSDFSLPSVTYPQALASNIKNTADVTAERIHC